MNFRGRDEGMGASGAASLHSLWQIKVMWTPRNVMGHPCQACLPVLIATVNTHHELNSMR